MEARGHLWTRRVGGEARGRRACGSGEAAECARGRGVRRARDVVGGGRRCAAAPRSCLLQTFLVRARGLVSVMLEMYMEQLDELSSTPRIEASRSARARRVCRAPARP